MEFESTKKIGINLAEFSERSLISEEKHMSINGDPNSREGFEWWDLFNKLKRYSFWRGSEDERGVVIQVPDQYGAWIKQYEAAELIDGMQEDINRLNHTVSVLERRLAMVRMSREADKGSEAKEN